MQRTETYTHCGLLPNIASGCHCPPKEAAASPPNHGVAPPFDPSFLLNNALAIPFVIIA